MTFKKQAAALTLIAAFGVTGASAQSPSAQEKCKSRGWVASAVQTTDGMVVLQDKKNEALFEGGVCSITLNAPAYPLKNKNDIPGDEPKLAGTVVVEIPLSDVEKEAAHNIPEQKLLEFGIAHYWMSTAKAADETDTAEANQKKIEDKLPGQMKDFARHIEQYTKSSKYVGIHARVSAVSYTVVAPDPAVVEEARAKVDAEKLRKAEEKAEKARRKKQEKEESQDCPQTPDDDPFGGTGIENSGAPPIRKPGGGPSL
jgi:hypothetical protein